MAPELEPWVLWVWRAWHRLSDDRPWIGGGMAAPTPGRIPWATVMEWADRHGYGQEAANVLDRLIGEMEAEYQDWNASRRDSGGT